MNKFTESQGTLARLLAKENITIQHGAYSTAFFDVKHRILGLPVWKDVTKDIYDLLCGHEVGHALYTPTDGLDNCPHLRKDYLNVVEDVRIESKIQETYPGLIACFRRGYADFMARDFFGVKDKDVNTLNFVDRINLKAKLGNLIDVKFSAEEEVIRNKIHSAKTWDDVLEATKALQDFVASQSEETTSKSNQNQDEQNAPDDGQQQSEGDQYDAASSSSASNDTSESAEPESEASGDTSADGEDSSEDSSAKDGMSTSSEDSESDNDEAKANSDSTAKDADGSQDSSKENQTNSEYTTTESTDTDRNADPIDFGASCPPVTTSKNLADNAEKLLDKSKEVLSTLVCSAPTKEERDETITTIDTLLKRREEHYQLFKHIFEDQEVLTKYASFMKQTKKVVSNMVKEFELRKSAYQYSRATESKTGALNLDRLHAYRVRDDLFLSVTNLANAKNHAMVLFVDYSESMGSVLPDVLQHVINVSLFCRQANIPFRVFAFTSDNGLNPVRKTPYYMRTDEAGYNRVLVSNLSLIELVNSDLNTNKFNRAIFDLYVRSIRGIYSRGEALGNTPLDEALIVAHDIVKDMQARFNPDRMITMFITDGDGQKLRAVEADAFHEKSLRKDHLGLPHPRVSFKVNGRTVLNTKIDGLPQNHTAALLENLRITTGAETIGFFIPNKISSAKVKLLAHMRSTSTSYYQLVDKAMEEYRENDLFHLKNAFGFSEYFIVAPVGALEIADDDLEIDSEWTRSRMAKKFLDFSQSKKTSRVFVNKFASAIA